jgi:predicted Zn-dependent protease
VPGWLTTHPFPEDRLSQTEERLASTQADYGSMVTNRDAFRQRLDGIVYGDDPRQGYFDGQAFYHPELKFQLVFPQGWATRNGVSAVTGISAKEDAIVQLGLAGSEPPRDLLQKFLAQEGVQAGQTSNASINGLPAATARFSANTQQGARSRAGSGSSSSGGAPTRSSATPVRSRRRAMMKLSGNGWAASARSPTRTG